MVLYNVVVPVRCFAGHLVKKRRAAGIHPVLRIAVLVQILLFDPTVDAAFRFVIDFRHREIPIVGY